MSQSGDPQNDIAGNERWEATTTESRQDACATSDKSRQDACATKPKYLSFNIPNPVQHWHHRGYLPHLTVENGSYFVTFRLGDSLPQTVLGRYQREREELMESLKRRPGGPGEHDLREIERLYSEKVEKFLDSGAGSCALREPEIATFTAGALKYFDGNRYSLHAWVVMPNHIHALLTPRTPHQLEAILHSWKSYTAKQANRLLGRTGEAFRQRESYDHPVRNDREFLDLVEYINMNPVNAGLCRRPEEWPWFGYSKRGEV